MTSAQGPVIALSGEVPPEIAVAAVPDDHRVWVPQAPNVWFRPLMFNTVTGQWCNLLKVTASGIVSRHRHPGAVFGYVIKGKWHYYARSKTGCPKGSKNTTRKPSRLSPSSPTSTSSRSSERRSSSGFVLMPWTNGSIPKIEKGFRRISETLAHLPKHGGRYWD